MFLWTRYVARKSCWFSLKSFQVFFHRFFKKKNEREQAKASKAAKTKQGDEDEDTSSGGEESDEGSELDGEDEGSVLDEEEVWEVCVIDF
jgi:ribosome biogenesis protein MAK21